MPVKSLKTLDHQIHALQTQLATLGPMRPGTLSRQYRQPQKRKGPYYQLSTTYQMKSRTEYVPKAQVAMVRQEIAVYRRYKRLTARWIELALRRSRLRMRLASSAGLESSPATGVVRAESASTRTPKPPKTPLSRPGSAKHSQVRKRKTL